MTKSLLFFWVLLGTLSGTPLFAYPSALDAWLPAGAVNRQELADKIQDSLSAEHPPLKNKATYEAGPPKVYFFFVDRSYAEARSFLVEKGVVFSHEMNRPPASKTFRKNPGGGDRLPGKFSLGHVRGWAVTLASHYYDPDAKKWIPQTSLLFTNIPSAPEKGKK